MHFLSISDNWEELRKPVYNSRHFLQLHVLVYEQFRHPAPVNHRYFLLFFCPL